MVMKIIEEGIEEWEMKMTGRETLHGWMLSMAKGLSETIELPIVSNNASNRNG